MKKYFVFIAFIFCYFSLFAQVDEPTPNQTQDLPDTVWTKNIWPENVVGVMFSPDGSQVYVSSDTRVWIINTLTGDSIKTISGIGAFKVISSDNKYIYTSTLLKLDAITFKILDSLKNRKYSIKDYQIRDLCITPDNKTLIVTGSTSGILSPQNYDLCRVNAETMELIEHIDYKGQILRVAISPDGKNFVTDWEDGEWMSKDYTKKLLLWDANTFKVIKEIYSDTSLSTIGYMKFTPDNKFLGVGLNGVINYYNTNDFSYNKKFTAFPLNNGEFNFSSDSKYMLSGGGVKTIIWDCGLDKKNVIYTYPYRGKALSFSPNMEFIISGSYELTLLNAKLFPTSVNDFPIIQNILNVLPNPTDGNSKIFFINSLAGNFDITIFDSFSKTIASISSGFLDLGEHSFLLNTNNMASGTYFCKVIGNSTNLVSKFIINR